MVMNTHIFHPYGTRWVWRSCWESSSVSSLVKERMEQSSFLLLRSERFFLAHVPTSSLTRRRRRPRFCSVFFIACSALSHVYVNWEDAMAPFTDLFAVSPSVYRLFRVCACLLCHRCSFIGSIFLCPFRACSCARVPLCDVCVCECMGVVRNPYDTHS